MRPKFSSSVQFSLTDTVKKIEKHQDVVSILPFTKDQIRMSHVCGFSLSAGSVIRGVIFLMRSLITSHGYKATLWDYQINNIQGWPIEMEHLRMQWVPTKKYFRQNFSFDLRTFWRSSKFYAGLFSNIQGAFFNCSAQISVLKRKTLFNQRGSFVHQEFHGTESLIGCPLFFILQLWNI